METTIRKKVTLFEMERIFENTSIKFYEPATEYARQNVDNRTEKVFFNIVVRHKENETGHSIINKELKVLRADKYAMTCKVTGQGLNEGFVWHNGDVFGNEKDLIDLIKKTIKDGIFEVEEPLTGEETDSQLMQISHNSEYHYWTDWYETLSKGDECYLLDGTKVIY